MYLKCKDLDCDQSFDPGSTAVLESIFHLNPPLPLNFYIDRYVGEVLVIQVTQISGSVFLKRFFRKTRFRIVN